MVNGIMVNAVPSLSAPGEPAPAQASLVNRGRDSMLTFRDGSVIVLKGVRRLDAVFPIDDSSRSQLPPVGREIGGDG